MSENDFRLPGRLQELLQALLCFLRSFCSAMGRIVVSMIMSRFTSFAKDSVIRSDQITKMFCSSCGCASTSSAKEPLLARLPHEEDPSFVHSNSVLPNPPITCLCTSGNGAEPFSNTPRFTVSAFRSPKCNS